MSSKKHQAGSTDDQRLVVWGEKRKDPDWDAFLAALIAYALREVDRSTEDSEEADA